MGDDPEVVSELIEKIVDSKSPKLRYVVGEAGPAPNLAQGLFADETLFTPSEKSAIRVC